MTAPPPPLPPSPRLRKLGHYAGNLVIVGLIRAALFLPYQTRVGFMGIIVEKLIGPVAGYRKRALSNLAHVCPELSATARKEIANGCLNNFGRSFIENYSGQEFHQRLAGTPLTGDGVAAFEGAVSRGQPVILVTGHYGNYEATRAVLAARGVNVGGLYRDMKNPYFNAHYIKTLQAFGGPVFAQGPRGTAEFVRHLKSGGQLVLLFDQHVIGAPSFDFLGHPAQTATSAAELALRYNALLIPFYGIRCTDGLSFDTVLEAPVPHSTPTIMTQAITDSLAARVRENPSQWFWVHRRWRAHLPD